MSGSAARGTRNSASDEDAGSGALPGIGEEGQGGPEWPPPQGSFGRVVRRQDTLLCAADDEEEEEESNSPPDGGRKKRAASTNLEAEAPKRGEGPLADNSAWDIDSSPERRPREKSLAAS